VAKYSSSGVKQWTQQFEIMVDATNDISLDASGNVYLTGTTMGGLDGNSNAGGTDVFIFNLPVKTFAFRALRAFPWLKFDLNVLFLQISTVVSSMVS